MADQSSFLKPILQELTYGASSWKKPVKVVATSNITLSGTQTVDGVALTAADEVLCVGQSTGSQNGVWVVARGAWTRRTDCDSADELFAGCRVSVTQGTHAGDVYRLTTTGRINVGTTSQTWALDVGSGSLTNVTAGSNISVTTPETGVRQVALSATPSVTSLTASSHLQIGASEFKRIADATPVEIGEQQIGDDGRLWAIGHDVGTPSAYLLAADQPLEVFYAKAADTGATDEVGEEPVLGPVFGEYSLAGNVLHLVCSDGVTANDTDYASFTFLVYNSAGTLVSSRVIHTKVTGSFFTGDITAHARKTVSVTSGFTIPHNGSVFFRLDKEGAGVVLPALRVSGKFIRTDFF